MHMQNVILGDAQVTGGANGMTDWSDGLLAAKSHAIKMIQHRLRNSFSDQLSLSVGFGGSSLIGQSLV